ncbi:DUF1467 family protein [Rhizobium sp. SSA_523]|uniref:DUF1467 family protein n=1 Tax=Rhizobium sp. SSA_523 TaxID=2952477 RepID=UPI002090D19D|nr:DUF1467 family protein [Rhizobium sp. SSA_523]MCO5730631.1 DUF1467 family protein [Rhizobium sp. SSA_523]WKC24539.1 DUF1467 family protein [Rhizobium sp. SSA_523]
MVSFLSAFAVYFIIWWITLFAVLPIGLRTQADENEVVLGTVASAPARFRAVRVLLLTTAISALVYGTWYLVSSQFGLSLSSLPRIVPDFGRT